MRRRRGSVLIASLIIMLFLMIFGGAMFIFSYSNRSAERQLGVMRARAAANALLFSVGSVVSDDCARPKASRVLPVSDGSPLTTTFQDGLISADMTISSTRGERVFLLECLARYGAWQSGKRALQIVRMSTGAGDVSEWLWK